MGTVVTVVVEGEADSIKTDTEVCVKTADEDLEDPRVVLAKVTRVRTVLLVGVTLVRTVLLVEAELAEAELVLTVLLVEAELV